MNIVIVARFGGVSRLKQETGQGSYYRQRILLPKHYTAKIESMNSTNPTSGICRPLYYEDYFIFDRESLLTLSSSSASADRTSVRNHEGQLIELYTSETRTVTVSIKFRTLEGLHRP